MNIMRPRATASFAAAILIAIVMMPLAAFAQSKLTGVYKGNDKAAALTQVVAYNGEPESGKAVTVLGQEPGRQHQAAVRRAIREIRRRACRENRFGRQGHQS
jgi:hypothetical protein